MESIRLAGMRSDSNLYLPLLGALGPSPSHEGWLRAPFFCGCRVAGLEARPKPRVWTSPFFLPLVQCDFLIKCRFLGRPRLLTRM
jgi:hypothetical protein